MSERTAVYRIYDGDGMLLYVGIARNFGARWAQHEKAQPWWPRVRHQTVDWYDSRDEALEVEAEAIRVERPEFNVRHKHPVAEVDLSTMLITPKDAALALGITRWRLNDLAAQRAIDMISISQNCRRVVTESLLAYMKKHKLTA